MPIRLLIFDLDGTLVDSLADIASAMNAVLRENGRSAAPTAVVKDAIGHGARQLVATLAPESTSAEIEAMTGQFLVGYEKNLLQQTRPFPGVLGFLEGQLALRQFAIVTNKPSRHTRKIIAGTALAGFPWIEILSGDSLPEKKPHPMPLLKCLASAGVTAAEAVMIGDGLPDLESARRAGIRSIALTGGYTKPDALTAQSPTAVAASFTELTATLAALDRA